MAGVTVLHQSESNLAELDVNVYGQLAPERQLAHRDEGYPSSWLEDAGPWLFALLLLVALAAGAALFFHY